LPLNTINKNNLIHLVTLMYSINSRMAKYKYSTEEYKIIYFNNIPVVSQ
jgi:hypothetical protein